VKAEGNDGSAIENVELLVRDIDGNVVDAGFTDRKGSARFRLPKGEYRVTGYLKRTYQLTEVDTKATKNVTLTQSTTIMLAFSDYPPEFTATIAFTLTLTSILIIVVALAIIAFLFLMRKRRKKKEDAEHAQ
jgi:amino acid transporter